MRKLPMVFKLLLTAAILSAAMFLSGLFAKSATPLITSQYYTWWGMAANPPKTLRPTSIIIVFGGGVMTTPPYFSMIGSANNSDSQAFHGNSPYSGKPCDYEDSIKAFAQRNRSTVLISVTSLGGGSAMTTVLSDTSATGSAVQLAQNIVWWCARHGIPGFEVDWETPANTTTCRSDMDFFMRTVRSLNPNIVIQLTAESWWDWTGNTANKQPYYSSTTVALANYIGFMEYNMENSKYCGESQPIYNNPNIHSSGWYWDYRGWKEAVAEGVPKSKIILYGSGEGKYYTGGSPPLTLGSAATETGGYISMSGQPVYIFSTASKYEYWDSIAHCTFYIDSTKTKYYNFESYHSQYDKSQYVLSNGLTGIGIHDEHYRLYDSRQAVPDSAIMGMINGAGGLITPPPPPPVSQCPDSNAIKARGYSNGYSDGFTAGEAYYKSLIPDTLKVAVPKP